jgi:Zn-dependent protease with chaperone function
MARNGDGRVEIWLVASHVTVPAVTTVVAGSYLVAGVSRHGGVVRLWYLLGSPGFVLVPLALSAAASRLREYEADDVAVECTSPEEFCTGLYLATAVESGERDGLDPETPGDERGPLDRLTAPYPTIDRRLARQGLDVATVTALAGRANERSGVTATDAGTATD